MAQPKADINPIEYMKLERAGYTHKEIAEKLCVGTATLSRWKKANDIRSYRDPSEYTRLHELGYTDKEIARKWGITPSGIHMWKRYNGLIPKAVTK